MSRPSSRPFDPTASSLLNLVIEEIHPLETSDDRIFIPSHGPFYTKSAVVRANGSLLVLGRDYEFKGMHRLATLDTGKSVACIIRILNKALTEVSVDYQVVGGKYSEVFSVFEELINNFGELNKVKIPYDNIAQKPLEFPPSAHRHPYWEFTGWQELMTPLNKILQGVHFRKLLKMRSAYEYFKSKEVAYNNWLDGKEITLLALITSIQEAKKEPINMVKIKNNTTPPNAEYSGVWAAINDRVLGGTQTPAKIGTTVNLSEDIIYPIPDNVIWDEGENPILRDDEEWIYQDNQYPVYPVPPDPDGIEFTAQEWDLYYWRGWRKTAHANTFNALLTADKTTINENETVIFTLDTNRYPVGTSVPYELTGLAQENTTTPLRGNLVLNSTGTATLSVKLTAGSPATFLSTMQLEAFIHGGVTKTVKYNLLANANKIVVANFVESVNDIIKKKAIAYELFYLMIDRTGFEAADSKDVQLNFTFNDGVKHPIKLDFNTTVTPGTPVTVNVDDIRDWFALSIANTATLNSTTLNLNISYNGKVVATKSIPVGNIAGTVYAVNADTNELISEIEDDVAFKFVADVNTTGSMAIAVTENTVGNELTPSLPSSVYIENLKAQTPAMMVSRRVRTLDDYVTVRFTSPSGKVIGSYRLKVKANT